MSISMQVPHLFAICNRIQLEIYRNRSIYPRISFANIPVSLFRTWSVSGWYKFFHRPADKDHWEKKPALQCPSRGGSENWSSDEFVSKDKMDTRHVLDKRVESSHTAYAVQCWMLRAREYCETGEDKCRTYRFSHGPTIGLCRCIYSSLRSHVRFHTFNITCNHVGF